MKKLLFLLILFLLSFNLCAQINSDEIVISKQARIEKSAYPKDSTLQYKSFKEFNGDTLAYVEYNFFKRVPEAYAGMTVQEFIDMLPFPVVSVTIGLAYRGGGKDAIHSVNVYVIDEYGKKTVDGKRAKLSIDVGISPYLRWDEWYDAKTDQDKENLIKKYTVTYAIAYKDLCLDIYKKLMEERKKIKEKNETGNAK